MSDNLYPKTAVNDDRWKAIGLLALDVDGVLTDGTVFIGADGQEMKQFSILDGLGLVSLKKLGVKLVIISGRMSGATSVRANELGFDEIIQGKKPKEEVLQSLIEKYELGIDQVCYVGDDAIDIPAIDFAGIGVSVPNGTDEAKEVADYITSRSGGQGAVREVCNRIIASRNETVLSLSRKS